MEKFRVTIVETTYYRKYVEAENEEEVKELLDNGDFVNEVLSDKSNAVDGDCECFINGNKYCGSDDEDDYED